MTAFLLSNSKVSECRELVSFCLLLTWPGVSDRRLIFMAGPPYLLESCVQNISAEYFAQTAAAANWALHAE